MPIKSVWLGLNFEEAALENIKESYACETYAVELCTREQAHLSVFLAAPVFKIPGVIPGAGLIPSWNAPVDEVNANRRAHAEEAQRRIASAVKSAGVTTEFHITQEILSTLAGEPHCLGQAERCRHPSSTGVLSSFGPDPD